MPVRSVASRVLTRLSLLGCALAISGALATSSCGGGDAPAAIDSGAPQASEPVEAPPPAAADEPPPGVDHTVVEGETLWDIARAYGVGVDAILEANDMTARDARRLRRGAVLRIPGASAPVEVATASDRAAAEPEVLPELTDGAWHRLGPGETLWDVARLYDVSVPTIVEANQLDDDGARMLRPGRAIAVPGITARDVERATQHRDADTAPRARGFRHTLARGETLWDLARSFGVSVAEIMAANGLAAGSIAEVREGTSLYIPGVERDATGQLRRRLSRAQQTAVATARRLGLGSHHAGGELLHGRLLPQWVREASRGFTRGRTPGSLRWPVANGWFVRGYGSGEGGYHLATDIMGEIGWNVRAAAAGIVGYSGDEIPGYGNTVLVIHPGGWVTMYAHNSANFVVAGERVPAGGILAELGSTGISRGPHVHFEMIFDGMNCDPSALFRPGIRHRDGHLTPMAPLTWAAADDRPDGVRCHRRMHHPRSRWVTGE